ncbi:non-specific lipid-transfer protein-like [Tripterygium wilfordii]|uniref:Non-specific lipid-transfer protein-like n=1 Tax=Tripterygium wilfordii TaxID=458696 RepID=A0A7J7C4X4_TRIWF|nr:non-specific lipid-transfer protein-like [Tripterygium wilfordii]
MAATKKMRQQLCTCFKNASKSFGVLPEKAKQVPQLCNVNVPVPIDPNIDCSKIN